MGGLYVDVGAHFYFVDEIRESPFSSHFHMNHTHQCFNYSRKFGLLYYRIRYDTIYYIQERRTRNNETGNSRCTVSGGLTKMSARIS